MAWFWYFFIYSGLGCGLELLYAQVTGGRPDRKRTLLLPLCPVYGLGACLVLLLTQPVLSRPGWAALLAALGATAAEYGTALFYEYGLKVPFWDYSRRRWNVQGRICPFFSLAWGVLSLPVLYGLHPTIQHWAACIPTPVTLSVMAAAGADLLISAWMLRCTGDRNCLRWYARKN